MSAARAGGEKCEGAVEVGTRCNTTRHAGARQANGEDRADETKWMGSNGQGAHR